MSAGEGQTHERSTRIQKIQSYEGDMCALPEKKHDSAIGTGHL